jgi:hypothetical protein
MALNDPDTSREGEVRFGGKWNDDEGYWEGGQLIFKWYSERDFRGHAPPRVVRIVELANKALDEQTRDLGHER